MLSVKDIVKKLDLQPHPEGGYYKETYRSEDIIRDTILGNEFNGSRNLCTGIYYLLESDDFSALHKINQDEMWHFYLGEAIELTMISEVGELSMVTIGNNVLNGEVLQFVVPKRYWFGARLLKANSFALVGCTVSPGFDFNDFKLGEREELLYKFPQHDEIIESLTRA
jgi:predicted cupin superfamily sugar epimerase